jgi:chromosome segregation protein
MRLERLDISGFKSFPDRASLAFDSGVTAIVGPNGCGKSNVVDAIAWVLGEQSARSLRGERMEDVIFSGSDARRATAAAEVRLRLTGVPSQAARRAAARLDGVDDPDAGGGNGQPAQIELPAVETRTVEIARRLYRSGESEYLLDGQVCRLRDIQDLLMDAGVGVRAYAVIEQGKIGQILSAKPADRRQLLEEAAGITKYKSRRRAAELKLEAAQQNLTRVDDIIFEIEKQRAALKRQAAKARRYRALREELRRWEKVLYARRHRALTQQLAGSRARLEEARQREAAAAAAVAEVERRLETCRAALHAADERLTAAREQAYARQLENERRQQQLEFDRQQAAAMAARLADLAVELEALQHRRAPAERELEARRAAAQAAAEEQARAARQLAAEDEALQAASRRLEDLERAVEDARSRVFANQTAAAALGHAIERAAEARDRLEDAMGRLAAEAADLEVERARAQAEQEAAAEGLAAARRAIEEIRAAREGRQAALAAARAEREACLAGLRERERDLAAVAARRQSLEELEAAREGYGEAARLLLADPEARLAHRGSVADHLETDGHWERAVEAALGDLLQCILVDDAEEMQRGLALVRDRDAGRAGFLLVGAVPSPPVGHPDPPAPGLRAIDSVLRVTGPYREAIRRAIGEVWICDAGGDPLAASTRTEAPVVTAGGDVYRRGLLVFGGARGEARGILATRREIKMLGERLASERAAVEQLARQAAALDAAVAEGEAAVDAFSAKLHEQEKAALAFEMQVARAAAEVDRLARKADQIATERRQVEEQRRTLEARREEAAASIAQLDADRLGLEAQFADAQRALSEAREAAASQARRAADARAAHAALVERAAALGAEVGRLEDAVADLVERIASRADEHRQAEERRAALAAAITEGERRLVEDGEALAALRGTVVEAEAGVGRLQREVEACEVEGRDGRLVLEDVRTEVARLEVARATTEADLHHLAASCVESLQLSIDEVVAEVEALEAQGHVVQDAAVVLAEDGEEEGEAAGDGDDAPRPHGEAGAEGRAVTAEEAIATLRGRIDRLGPVNMMAIEQFDELESRHAFLCAQRQDLVDSIAATGEAIKRIDRTTRERFKEAFTAINRYFEETFTTLFGGGRAGLVLLDENDLLESGIDIIAQPPGKRLQSVQLLSGGEKALTAMALMFGIFKYRPSPFCLLDEIDAPLDDANIGRFVEMLRGMQRDTQFVLITHNRKTMEIADRLYGVTMEEPGVSKLISLKLN